MIAHPRGYLLVPYRDPDAIPSRRIQRIPSGTFNGSTPEIRFVVDGRIQGKAVADATLIAAPCAVSGGIAGTFEGIADGASIVDTATGFVSWKGYGRIFSGNGPSGVAQDGSILIVSRGGEFPIGAWIVRGKRKLSVGPADWAAITPNGTVWGMDHRDSSDRNEAFVWRRGHRRNLG